MRTNVAGRSAVPSRREQERAVRNEVRAIYQQLEKRPILRTCSSLTGCCQFRITGRTPQLTRGEALVAAQGVRASGRKALPFRADGACPLLHETGRCLIYADRPFGCRTHFCAAAGGPYARGEVIDLIRQLEAIDSRVGGKGPRELTAALTQELA